MFTIFFRTLVIFTVLLVVIRLMGKRQLGEMEPFELVITLVIAEIACIPMGDSGLPLSYGIISILTLFFLHQLIGIIGEKSIKARRLLNGKPTVVIDKNGINYYNMKAADLTVNDLQQSMRAEGYFNFDEIMYGVLEGNGRLSVLPYAPPSAPPPQANLPITLILEGKFMRKELTQAGLAEDKLKDKIKKEADAALSDILYLGLDAQGKMYIQPKGRKYVTATIPDFKGDW